MRLILYFDAHKAWQKAKIETIEYVINSDESCILQPKLTDALIHRISVLTKDIKNGEITCKL